MGYSFCNLAKETLSIAKKPLSIHDIWRLATEFGLSEKVITSGKTPWQTIGARIYTDIKENPNSDFVQVSRRPAKFYLKELYEHKHKFDDNKENTVESSINYTYNERDLHILLSTFVYANPHFKCYTKTIFHENSKKIKKGIISGYILI